MSSLKKLIKHVNEPYFPSYSTNLGNLKVELDLTGYATKKRSG